MILPTIFVMFFPLERHTAAAATALPAPNMVKFEGAIVADLGQRVEGVYNIAETPRGCDNR